MEKLRLQPVDYAFVGGGSSGKHASKAALAIGFLLALLLMLAAALISLFLGFRD